MMSNDNAGGADTAGTDATTATGSSDAPQDNNNRVPVYELHIQPMFRLLDAAHMIVQMNLDLSDPTVVWNKSGDILPAVSNGGGMPPTGKGGPWPDEWVSLYTRWLTTGSASEPIGHHLVLTAPDSGQYKLTSSTSNSTVSVSLSAVVTPPTSGYGVWFNLDSVTDTQRFYSLWMEPPYPAQSGAGRKMPVMEMPFPQGNLTSIVITDKNGQQTLQIPPPS
ncbi:MAG TPA: hypothetical protein VGE04_15975 [Chloroflexia bacterium]|jgi:hypothetical protein